MTVILNKFIFIKGGEGQRLGRNLAVQTIVKIQILELLVCGTVDVLDYWTKKKSSC